LRLVDLGLTLEAAVAGQGVELARPRLARLWLAGGSLKPLFGIAAEPATQYYLAPCAGAAATAFADWLAGACAEVEHEAQEALSGAG
ncbi:MAG: LysR family transcriptional regulator, partial [Rubrivivax sp.]